MHVRSLDESKLRFARNSIRAFLDDESQGLPWLKGVLRSSGVPIATLELLVRNEVACRQPSARTQALQNWIDGQ